MKKLTLLVAVIATSFTTFAQVGIGTTTPHASAALDITSTTSGFLPPRMTEAQRNVISTPAAGLMVYCTDCGDNGEPQYFNGIAWVNMIGGAAAAGSTVADAPGIGTAVASSSPGQAVVPFTAPASNGGSAITSYTATSSPGGVTGTLSQSGSGSITVTGLTNGTSYTFTVTATNGIGTSLASTVSNSVTPLSTVVVNTTASTTLTFMAHNLGADYSLDAHIPVQGIHGNYYRWGRSTIVANASTSSAAIGGWNTVPAAANGAWADGSKTANDPCPAGYRVPTIAQWNLVDSYNAQTTTGSFSNNETNFGAARQFGSGANTLTLPAAGFRANSNGALYSRGSNGFYWSSSVTSTYALYLSFTSSNASTSVSNRADSFSVRCVSE
jgi:uncharacterized protein (TIGR02145 family)